MTTLADIKAFLTLIITIFIAYQTRYNNPNRALTLFKQSYDCQPLFTVSQVWQKKFLFFFIIYTIQLIDNSIIIRNINDNGVYYVMYI